MLQLILGNIGVRGGGMNALRGHSNIQGLTDLGLLSDMLPGYLDLPSEKEPDFDDLSVNARTTSRCGPTKRAIGRIITKFFVSLQKAMFGDGGDGRRTTGPTIICPSSTCRPTTCCRPSS